LALASVSAQAQEAAKPFRIFVPGAGLSNCAPTGDAEAYRAHLEKRLERPVRLCAAGDTTAAAAALVASQADMVILDPPAYTLVAGKARAILAGRVSAATGRVLSVALVLKRSGKTSFADLADASPIVAGRLPASNDVPMQALADAGAPVASFKAVQVIEGDDPAFAALRAGRGNVLVVTAGARQRACMSLDVKVDPCADLTEVWSGRPLAPRALVVSNAMPVADRHQLVGIHIALHFEAPKAMAFMARAMPPAVAIDPTEAGALLARRR
jgi:ABC-type phosphate/phosphonate transport system substrate-binding protein